MSSSAPRGPQPYGQGTFPFGENLLQGKSRAFESYTHSCSVVCPYETL